MDVRCQVCGKPHTTSDAPQRVRVVHFRCAACFTLHVIGPSGAKPVTLTSPSPRTEASWLPPPPLSLAPPPVALTRSPPVTAAETPHDDEPTTLRVSPPATRTRGRAGIAIALGVAAGLGAGILATLDSPERPRGRISSIVEPGPAPVALAPEPRAAVAQAPEPSHEDAPPRAAPPEVPLGSGIPAQPAAQVQPRAPSAPSPLPIEPRTVIEPGTARDGVPSADPKAAAPPAVLPSEPSPAPGSAADALYDAEAVEVASAADASVATEATPSPGPADEAAVEAPPISPPPIDAPIDERALKAAMAAAASRAAACSVPEGPRGSGRVAVTVAPSGRVTLALVEGPPFAGTAVGTCVAQAFRAVSVPPFSGGYTKVYRSFTVR
jgi:hypothetical protein